MRVFSLKKAERLAQRAQYWPEEKYGKPEIFERLTIYRYELAGRFYGLIFRSTTARPMAHYAFKSIEYRERFIDERKAGETAAVKSKAEWDAKRRAENNTLKVGDIVYDSWGYDQTNIDYFQVVKRTAHRLWVRKIAEQTVPGSEGFMCETVLPVKDHFLSEKVYMVAAGKYIVWDGRPKYQSHYA